MVVPGLLKESPPSATEMVLQLAVVYSLDTATTNSSPEVTDVPRVRAQEAVVQLLDCDCTIPTTFTWVEADVVVTGVSELSVTVAQ